MKCKACGKNFKTNTELNNHKKKTACGLVDTSKPLICSFAYNTVETKDIVVPVKVTLRIQVEHIEVMPAQTKRGEFVRTDNVNSEG